MLELIDRYRTAMIVVLSIFVGTILLIFAYFSDKVHPFTSFLLLQIGGLMIFGAGYTALSDYFVRKNFEQQVRTAIDFVRLDQSIKDSGLIRIKKKFSGDDLDAIRQSTSVSMLVLRSDGFFKSNYEELRARIQQGNLALTVILPDPRNFELMSLLSAKFSDYNDPRRLAESIQTVVNVWLRGEIHQRLPEKTRSRFNLLLIQKYPLYSAYEFDRKELWYIPYHYRNNYQSIPVFVLGTGFEQTEVYRDFTALKEEAQRCDLSGELVLPAFPNRPIVPAVRGA